jgi:hypothetical protein
MSLAMARAAASLANPVPNPAAQQLNMLNQLLAQNQLVRSGALAQASVAPPPPPPPVQSVAPSTMPVQAAPVPGPIKYDPVVEQVHTPSLSFATQVSAPTTVATPSASSTVSAQSYAEQLKRNFEAHLRANNIPIPQPQLPAQNQNRQVSLAPGQSVMNQLLVPPVPLLPAPDDARSKTQSTQSSLDLGPPAIFGRDTNTTAAAKKPPLSMKAAKSSSRKPPSKKEKLSLEGKLSVKHHHSKAAAAAAGQRSKPQGAKPTPVKSAPKGEKPRTAEDKAAGTILVSFLSSLRDSYEDALRARGETTRLEESDDTDGTRSSKVPNVTDCSSLQQPESSIDDSDWNSDKKTDPSSSEDSDKDEKEGRRNSGTHDSHKGPPRKRLKRIAMENNGAEDERDQ